MRLDQIVAGTGAQITGDASTSIADVAYDSRRVEPGALFVALRGQHTDGHTHLTEALDAGAAALLVERAPARALPVPIARVDDTRAVLGPVSAAFFGHPGCSMRLVGVTGTNGKTSTVRMLEAILRQAGLRAGSMGTISTRYDGTEEAAQLTTGEATDLQRSLALMREARVEVVAMEVSSHSLAQRRVAGLHFAAAVFTNLTQDHLDFHETMEAYADAKAELFTRTYLRGPAVLHAGDPLSAQLAENAKASGAPVLTFGRGRDSGADLRTDDEQITLDGSRFILLSSEGEVSVELPLAGDFQIENALAAAGAARALDIDWAEIALGLERCEAVPGRLERVAIGDPAVFVDYAHTPDALDSVLSRVRPLASERGGRLLCVFGCGGDRDRTKRAPMARAACRHGDLVIATSDNPRTEDPAAILEDVREGLSGLHEVIESRRAAIQRAIALAEPADVVVIAGKGHEDYQIIGTEKLPFDDRVEVRRALARENGAS